MAIKPLYEVVRNHLIDLIENGGLESGDLIPSEAQLSKQLQVSVGTVRKAIDQLEVERRVYRHQGKGTYVSRIDFDNSLFRFFSYGDSKGSAARFSKSTPIRKRVRGNKAICAQLGVATGTPLIYLERIGSNDQGDPVLVEKCWWLAELVEGIQDEDVHIPDLLYAVIEEKFGVHIVRSEETLTAEAADSENAKLLAITAGAPVVVLRRHTYTVNDRLIEYRVTRGRADQFSYKTQIR
jgi:GntR family transcriptional regulator